MIWRCDIGVQTNVGCFGADMLIAFATQSIATGADSDRFRHFRPMHLLCALCNSLSLRTGMANPIEAATC